EPLETRTNPVAFGVAWPRPTHLSLSFAPDGTMMAPDGTIFATHESNLFATLDPLLDTASWQALILEAFQEWALPANIDIRVVPHGGQPFGSAGAAQGDGRFGDIRIGATPLSSDVLAVSLPYQPVSAGTRSGDVFLNSAHAFTADEILPVL